MLSFHVHLWYNHGIACAMLEVLNDTAILVAIAWSLDSRTTWKTCRLDTSLSLKVSTISLSWDVWLTAVIAIVAVVRHNCTQSVVVLIVLLSIWLICLFRPWLLGASSETIGHFILHKVLHEWTLVLHRESVGTPLFLPLLEVFWRGLNLIESWALPNWDLSCQGWA